MKVSLSTGGLNGLTIEPNPVGVVVSRDEDIGVDLSEMSQGRARSIRLTFAQKPGQVFGGEVIVVEDGLENHLNPEIGNERCTVITRYRRIEGGSLCDHMYLSADGKTWKPVPEGYGGLPEDALRIYL